MTTGTLIRPDLAGKEAWLWMPMLDMMRKFTEEHFDELDVEWQTRFLLARALCRDPKLRLYAGLSDEDGKLLGFAVATIEEQGPARWIFSLAGEIHGDDGTIAERYFKSLEAWGREVGAEQILHATSRSARAWTRKYKFESKRVVMARSIPHGD